MRTHEITQLQRIFLCRLDAGPPARPRLSASARHGLCNAIGAAGAGPAALVAARPARNGDPAGSLRTPMVALQRVVQPV